MTPGRLTRLDITGRDGREPPEFVELVDLRDSPGARASFSARRTDEEVLHGQHRADEWNIEVDMHVY